MLFGHNSNVKAGDTTYHVQTEDRGTTNALIDTTVYFHGRVLHRRTNNYFDLLPLNPDTEQALKLRLDEQHHTVVEEIRTGALHLSLPQDENDAARAAAPTSKALLLELINAKTWLTGKRALLQVAVRNRTNQAVQGAKVTARVNGAAEISEYSTETGPFGHAQLEFAMPRLAGAEPALVIEASHGNARGHLRFQLRTKPRVPSAR
ncbi:MAG: hypothetical protein DMG56_01610 [Acidobacteria bacterium]|nr:MAG: hypothetical protein DMG54_13160 [Acidobacteriota bacterium]PYU65985.1 MAG: hypothetical protein DMG56_01610 [Acidobacteriota bacterium]PYU74810.1 MAG: hypothetical protein DMG52_09495 [Acidobacteriota bacterium]